MHITATIKYNPAKEGQSALPCLCELMREKKHHTKIQISEHSFTSVPIPDVEDACGDYRRAGGHERYLLDQVQPVLQDPLPASLLVHPGDHGVPQEAQGPRRQVGQDVAPESAAHRADAEVRAEVEQDQDALLGQLAILKQTAHYYFEFSTV